MKLRVHGTSYYQNVNVGNVVVCVKEFDYPRVWYGIVGAQYQVTSVENDHVLIKPLHYETVEDPEGFALSRFRLMPPKACLEDLI